jgi:hypothetical protein
MQSRFTDERIIAILGNIEVFGASSALSSPGRYY